MATVTYLMSMLTRWLNAAWIGYLTGSTGAWRCLSNSAQGSPLTQRLFALSRLLETLKISRKESEALRYRWESHSVLQVSILQILSLPVRTQFTSLRSGWASWAPASGMSDLLVSTDLGPWWCWVLSQLHLILHFYRFAASL